MRFRVLGPLEIETDDGPVVVSGQRPRALLTALLLQPNDRRVDRPPRGRAVGRGPARVARQRAAAGGDPAARPPGALGRLRPHRAGRLPPRRRRTARSTPTRSSGLPAGARADGRRPGAGGPGPGRRAGAVAGTGVRRVRQRVRAGRRGPPGRSCGTAALEDRVELLLRRGAATDAVAQARDLVAAEPLRERRVALLMRALHADGRVADALDAYRDHRRLLAEELGLDPPAGLRELEARILADDLPAPPRPGPRPPATARRAPRAAAAAGRDVGPGTGAGAAPRLPADHAAGDAGRPRRGRQDPAGAGGRTPARRAGPPGLLGGSHRGRPAPAGRHAGRGDRRGHAAGRGSGGRAGRVPARVVGAALPGQRRVGVGRAGAGRGGADRRGAAPADPGDQPRTARRRRRARAPAAAAAAAVRTRSRQPGDPAVPGAGAGAGRVPVGRRRRRHRRAVPPPRRAAPGDRAGCGAGAGVRHPGVHGADRRRAGPARGRAAHRGRTAPHAHRRHRRLLPAADPARRPSSSSGSPSSRARSGWRRPGRCAPTTGCRPPRSARRWPGSSSSRWCRRSPAGSICWRRCAPTPPSASPSRTALRLRARHARDVANRIAELQWQQRPESEPECVAALSA